MAEPPALVVVGRVLRPQGVRGELRVQPETDFPERLGTLSQAVLVTAEGSTPVRLEAVRAAGEAVLVKVAGVDTPEAARRFSGAHLAVPRELAAALPEGRHYVFEVLGLTAVTEEGHELGTVEAVIRTPGNDVYVVRGAREVLVPAISSVVLRIDLAHRRMLIRPMPGMLEEP